MRSAVLLMFIGAVGFANANDDRVVLADTNPIRLAVEPGSTVEWSFAVARSRGATGPAVLTAEVTQGLEHLNEYHAESTDPGCGTWSVMPSGTGQRLVIPVGTLAPSESRTCSYRISRPVTSKGALSMRLCTQDLAAVTCKHRLMIGSASPLKVAAARVTDRPEPITMPPGSMLAELKILNSGTRTVTHAQVESGCQPDTTTPVDPRRSLIIRGAESMTEACTLRLEGACLRVQFPAIAAGSEARCQAVLDIAAVEPRLNPQRIQEPAFRISEPFLLDDGNQAFVADGQGATALLRGLTPIQVPSLGGPARIVAIFALLLTAGWFHRRR